MLSGYPDSGQDSPVPAQSPRVLARGRVNCLINRGECNFVHLRQDNALTFRDRAASLAIVKELVLPPEENRKELGLAVSTARTDAGMTLDQLIEKAGIGRRTLIEIEQGRANPSVRILHRIAHATNCPMERFVSALCTGHTPPG